MNRYFWSQEEYDVLDIFDMFSFYNSYFFEGQLEKCFVGWSERMTSCAGLCENKGDGCCEIKLSSPLLKYRTGNELKQTLLHEMIHAYLFVTDPQACMSEGGHGKEFKEMMKNINQITNLQITVYHNFKDQVQLYRKHVWRCNGICKDRAPYYGYVKRSMNRKPQPADKWFSDHKRTCGGEFLKVSEPPQSKKAQKNTKKRVKDSQKQNTLNNYFKKAKEEQEKVQEWGNGKKISDYIEQMKEEKLD